jgi:hypothetical protein
MEKLKKLGAIIGTTAALVAGPVEAVAETKPNTTNRSITNIANTDLVFDADAKLTLQFGKLGLFGKAGFRALPIETELIGKHPDYPFDESMWVTRTMSNQALSIGVGADFELNKITKLVAGIDLRGGINNSNEIDIDGTRKQGYRSRKYYAGVNNKINLAPKLSTSIYSGLFSEKQRAGPSNDLSHIGSDRGGVELGINFEHRLSKRMSLEARAGYALGIIHGGDGNRGELSAGIGLNYKLPIRMPDVDLDWEPRQPKQKRYKPPKRKAVKSTVPCYAYPTKKFPEKNVPFIRRGG